MNPARFLLLITLIFLAFAALAQEKKDTPLANLSADAELVETRAEIPLLKAAAPGRQPQRKQLSQVLRWERFQAGLA